MSSNLKEKIKMERKDSFASDKVLGLEHATNFQKSIFQRYQQQMNADCTPRSLNQLNPHIERMDEDILYHIALGNKTHDLQKMFKDLRFIVMGGTPKRMEQFAYYAMKEIGYELPPGTILSDISRHSHRYAMYKVGPILSVSHGMGMPSIGILLHELIKLVHHAGVKDPLFVRIGTCGGFSKKAGTVVISEEVVNDFLEPVYELPILGTRIRFAADLNQDIVNEFVSIANTNQDGFETIKGVTYCTDNFYEGSGRADGAICEFSDAEVTAYYAKLKDVGVVNVEMESLAFAAITCRAGIKSIVLSVIFSDRLETDQIKRSKEVLDEWQTYPQKLLVKYIKKNLSIPASSKTTVASSETTSALSKTTSALSKTTSASSETTTSSLTKNVMCPKICDVAKKTTSSTASSNACPTACDLVKKTTLQSTNVTKTSSSSSSKPLTTSSGPCVLQPCISATESIKRTTTTAKSSTGTKTASSSIPSTNYSGSCAPCTSATESVKQTTTTAKSSTGTKTASSSIPSTNYSGSCAPCTSATESVKQTTTTAKSSTGTKTTSSSIPSTNDTGSCVPCTSATESVKQTMATAKSSTGSESWRSCYKACGIGVDKTTKTVDKSTTIAGGGGGGKLSVNARCSPIVDKTTAKNVVTPASNTPYKAKDFDSSGGKSTNTYDSMREYYRECAKQPTCEAIESQKSTTSRLSQSDVKRANFYTPATREQTKDVKVKLSPCCLGTSADPRTPNTVAENQKYLDERKCQEIDTGATPQPVKLQKTISSIPTATAQRRVDLGPCCNPTSAKKTSKEVKTLSAGPCCSGPTRTSTVTTSATETEPVKTTVGGFTAPPTKTVGGVSQPTTDNNVDMYTIGVKDQLGCPITVKMPCKRNPYGNENSPDVSKTTIVPSPETPEPGQKGPTFVPSTPASGIAPSQNVTHDKSKIQCCTSNTSNILASNVTQTSSKNDTKRIGQSWKKFSSSDKIVTAGASGKYENNPSPCSSCKKKQGSKNKSSTASRSGLQQEIVKCRHKLKRLKDECRGYD